MTDDQSISIPQDTNPNGNKQPAAEMLMRVVPVPEGCVLVFSEHVQSVGLTPTQAKNLAAALRDAVSRKKKH